MVLLLSAVAIGLLTFGGSASAALDSLGGLVSRTWKGQKYGCKCYPDDPCWPSAEEWKAFNSSLNGRLSVDVPPGAVCYQTFQGPLGNVSTYDAAKCAEAVANFGDEQWQINQPAANLWTYFTNDTCRPAINATGTCTLGNYPVYVAFAHNNYEMKLSLAFAKKHNLRFVVRNTGHDFLGRSIGWGSLVVNTHHGPNVPIFGNWSGPGAYSGPSVTVAGGDQAFQVLSYGSTLKPPMLMVTGECATVGVAGGLIQGGGHGPLTTLYGFLADNALEFYVLTAAGDIVQANSEKNPDLFWALRGGGPAAFGIILSATYRAIPDMPSAGATLYINSTHTSNVTLFWKGMEIFHRYSNRYVDNGLYVYYELGTGGPISLTVKPFVAFGQNTTQLAAILKPLYDELHAIGLNYTSQIFGYKTFYDLYIDLFDSEVAGNSALTGGWTMTHEDVAANNTAIVAGLRNALNKGGVVVGHMWDAGHGLPKARWNESAMHPRFRRASDKVITILPIAGNAPLAEKEKAQRTLTFDIDQAFRDAAPKGAAYVNEADPFQPNWQQNFWGSNYERLVDIRKTWDPEGVFYAVSTPGTEDWVLIEDGIRLCKRPR